MHIGQVAYTVAKLKPLACVQASGLLVGGPVAGCLGKPVAGNPGQWLPVDSFVTPHRPGHSLATSPAAITRTSVLEATHACPRLCQRQHLHLGRH